MSGAGDGRNNSCILPGSMDSNAGPLREFSEKNLFDGCQVGVGRAILFVVANGLLDFPRRRVGARVIAVTGENMPVQVRLRVSQAFVI